MARPRDSGTVRVISETRDAFQLVTRRSMNGRPTIRLLLEFTQRRPAARSENTNLRAPSDLPYSAVEHPPHVPLQILAGPGSGKTKVDLANVTICIVESYSLT